MAILRFTLMHRFASFLFAATLANASVLYTTFGAGQTFSPAQYSISGGASPEAIAAPFQPSQTATLDSVDLALEIDSGTDSFIVNLAQDNSGTPGTVLESFVLSGIPNSATVETVNSTLHSLLSVGNTYWIEVLAGGADTAGGWDRNNQGFNGLSGSFNNGVTWQADQTSEVSTAFDVNGTAAGVPEPATGWLIAGGFAILAIARWRRQIAQIAGVLVGRSTVQTGNHYILGSRAVSLALGLLVLFATEVRASVTSCAGQSMGTMMSAGDNGNTPANGCGQVDLGFNGFSTPTSFGNVPPPGASSITLNSLGGGTSGDIIDPIQLTIAAPWSVSSASSIKTMGTDFNTLAATIPGQSPPPESGNYWAITGLSVSGGNYTAVTPAVTGDFISISEFYCLGGAYASCAPGNKGFVNETITFNTDGTQTVQYQSMCAPFDSSCFISDTTAATVNFGSLFYTTVGLMDEIAVTNAANSGVTLSLNSFTETFDQVDETPEPAAAILLATGLSLLAFRRFRASRSNCEQSAADRM